MLSKCLCIGVSYGHAVLAEVGTKHCFLHSGFQGAVALLLLQGLWLSCTTGFDQLVSIYKLALELFFQSEIINSQWEEIGEIARAALVGGQAQ